MIKIKETKLKLFGKKKAKETKQEREARELIVFENLMRKQRSKSTVKREREERNNPGLKDFLSSRSSRSSK